MQYTLLEQTCDEEFTLSARIEAPNGWPEGSAAELVFHSQDEKNYCAVRFNREKIAFLKVQDGEPQRWGDMDEVQPGTMGPSLTVSLKRRAWRLTLICNQQVVGHAYDLECRGGRIGSGVQGGGLRVTDLQYQPTEEVYFTDDFARAKEETGTWEILSGSFVAAEARIGKSVRETSANPFAWKALASGGPALCRTGYWFWDDYLLEAAVKPETEGQVGLCAFVQDAQNYLAFRWASQGQPGAERFGRQLVRVVHGQATLLASAPGGYLPGQWYRLGLRVHSDRVTAFIDGETACAAEERAFGQGGIGLWAEAGTEARFDDIRAERTEGFQEDFSRPSLGKWTDLGGVWQTQPKGPNTAYRTRLEGEETLSLAGEPSWDDYIYGVDLDPEPQGQAGLAFGVRDAANYHFFALTYEGADAPDLPRFSLGRVRAGRREVWSEARWRLDPDRWHRLKVELHRGHVQAFVNNHLLFDAFEPEGTAGRIGFYAAGAGQPKFDNVFLWFPPEPKVWSEVTEQFAKEDTMAPWSRPQSLWREASGVFWHLGNFLSETSLEAPLTGLHGEGTATLAIHTDGSNLDSGYALVVRGDPAGQRVVFELRRQGGTVVTTSKAHAELSDQATLRLSREGRYVVATLDEQPLLHYGDSAPLTGGHVACQAQGLGLSLPQARAECPTLRDYTFVEAPVDWWAARGQWETAARWPCDERWSWLGGLESESPILWSKRAYTGDLTLEAYVALYMDNPADMQVGYSHPSDLNVAICGDGRDLSSGYSFVFAGWNNTRSAIFRRDELVVQQPGLMMKDPRRVNLEFQRHWYHLRVDKSGPRIRFAVDGQALEFEDKDPLPGGQVALWSYRNGIMVARARIWYEEASAVVWPASIPRPEAAPGGWQTISDGGVSLVSDFEAGVDLWTTKGRAEGPLLSVDDTTSAHGQRSLKVLNPVTGGDFSVWVGVQSFDAVRFPRLAFDYRIGPDVKVNLYAKVKGQWVVIGFTDPDQPGEGVRSLGSVEKVVADRQWHTAEVDLLGRLRMLYPNDGSLEVTELSFASPRVEYLRSGLGGNRWGSFFHLDYFRLLGAADTTPDHAGAVVLREASRD